MKNFLSQNLVNVRGWRSDTKLVVIESDDWGTIRTTADNYRFFLKKGFPVDQCAYNRNDCLESNDDLELLFETLQSVKNRQGDTPVITANMIMGNPDFKKIKENGYSEYFVEPMEETLRQYPNHDRVLTLYRQGIENKIFQPQFHGREHVNVFRWVKALQDPASVARLIFEHNMFSIHDSTSPVYKEEFMDALNVSDASQLTTVIENLKHGLSLFKTLWGFESKSFIAPCYIWHSNLEDPLQKLGVKYFQGIVNQKVPLLTDDFGIRYKRHYQGQQNDFGQRYLVRNCFFEPSTAPHLDWVDDCLSRVKTAFRWKKPAIISAHRLNFIGAINENNRTKNLAMLKKLLGGIVKTWPDVQFISSDQLGEKI